MNNWQAFLDWLTAQGVAHTTQEHEPFTSALTRPTVDTSGWEFPVKNFLVYDKNPTFYLITVHLDCPPLDFKAIGQQVGARGHLSFAKAEDLANLLGVLPGSVSPYAVYLPQAAGVKVVLDARLQQARTLSAHPLSNDRTTTIAVADLLKLYHRSGHTPRWLDLPFKAAVTAA